VFVHGIFAADHGIVSVSLSALHCVDEVVYSIKILHSPILYDVNNKSELC
jgi:hypothetical protein